MTRALKLGGVLLALGVSACGQLEPVPLEEPLVVGEAETEVHGGCGPGSDDGIGGTGCAVTRLSFIDHSGAYR